MTPARIVVFLPCHTLDDFPTWLEESEADDLLAAWTAAWDPRLIAAVGAMPEWASIDLRPPDEMPILGIVPAKFDPRFAGQADATCLSGSKWVRETTGSTAIVQRAVSALGLPADGPLLGAEITSDDFHALGLVVLLSELLARRMRSATNLETTSFSAAVVAAARAAVEGRAADARAGLEECFGSLEAARSQYYPVDVWMLDLVLLAESTLGSPLLDELASPTPLGIVATGAVVAALAAKYPASLARLRERCAAGTVAACGGRDDDAALDGLTPEQILGSFVRGLTTWRECLGVEPRTFARISGGASAILPQLLSGLGYAGAIWPLFDGTPLPDPAAARIRWEGTGGGCIDGVGRPPLDAREARTILALHERIGDAMDHDHTAIVMLAHFAGTASPWLGLLRRVGLWTTALGTFVTPDELFRRTEGAGTLVSFEPDAFPVPTPTGAVVHGQPDPIGAAITAHAEEARRILGQAHAVRSLMDQRDDALRPARGQMASPHRSRRPALLAGGWPWSVRGATAAEFVLDNGLVRLQANPRTGGLLSLRRPSDRGNRLSQQIALRTTRPAAGAGHSWESPEERAEHSLMKAEVIARVKTAEGEDCLESRGRLLDAGSVPVGSFVQRMSLVDGLPLAVLEMEVRLERAADGPVLEHHAACRFAWHENEGLEICRSLHTQQVVTERMRFTAPHFVSLCGGPVRGAAADDVTVLTGGLPWHVRSGPHMLDSVLLAGGGMQAVRRVAVGIGLERPWDAALAFLVDEPARIGMGTGPDNLRITVRDLAGEAGRIVRATVGLLESAGRAGQVRIDWAAEPVRAEACDLRGRPREDVTVAIEGRSTVVFLRRYEWLHLKLEFR
jgi:hypothetical protein